MSEPRIPELLKILSSSPLHVYFPNESIGDSGVKIVSEYLKTNVTTKSLTLWSNKFTDVGAQYLSEALKVNRSLITLELDNNRIGKKGAEALLKSLKTNRTLFVMSLNNNRIRTGNNPARKILVEKEIKNELKDNISGRKKERFEIGMILLLSRSLEKDSVFYKENLPLDIFKIIFKTSLDIIFPFVEKIEEK